MERDRRVDEEKGQLPWTAPAPIVVFKDAPPRTRDAAATLAEYIGRVSGQKPAVFDGEPSPMAGLHPDSSPAKAKKPRANDLDLN